jgi:hypothetical protein
MDLSDAADRFIEELHGLEYQDGRLDCSAGDEPSTSGGRLLEVELHLSDSDIEVGFGAAVRWLRAAFQQSSVPASDWNLHYVEMEIEPDQSPGPRVVRRAPPGPDVT